jgi:peptidyl-prolyl cis-trans isomerase A (cyclophilin A)
LLSAGTALLAQTPPAKSAAPPATKAPAAPAVNPLLHPESLKAVSPASYVVKFSTTHGDFVVTVHRDWSPNGSDRFYNLVRSHYFTNVAFFRNVPGFIVQFGMAPDPKIGAVWQNATIKDDPAKAGIHNTKGTLVFATAGPNTRSNQFFVNTNDNTGSLDSQGFTPFGEVTDGMDVVMGLYPGYGERPDQNSILTQGKAYLYKNFPKLDSIKSATIVPAGTTAAPAAPAAAAPPKK